MMAMMPKRMMRAARAMRPASKPHTDHVLYTKGWTRPGRMYGARNSTARSVPTRIVWISERRRSCMSFDNKILQHKYDITICLQRRYKWINFFLTIGDPGKSWFFSYRDRLRTSTYQFWKEERVISFWGLRIRDCEDLRSKVRSSSIAIENIPMGDFLHTDNLPSVLLDYLDDGVGISIASLGGICTFQYQDETILISDQINLKNLIQLNNSIFYFEYSIIKLI